MIKSIYKTETTPAGSIERIPTGIEALDNVISGGIPRGTMTLLSGKSNGGKSTIVSQMIAEAQDLNHKILWYSGESSEGTAKEKLSRQTAGGRYIYTDTDPITGKDCYYLSDDIQGFIERYYGDKVMFFVPEADDSRTALLNQFAKAQAETKADIIVVDNVMSLAATIGGNDLFQTQRQIAHYFSDLAASQNIWCILCAHISTKQKGNNAIGQGATSGASEIPQSASLVLTITTDREGHTDGLIIDKIRDEIGASVPKGTKVPIFYDSKAMRTYSYVKIDDKGRTPEGWDTAAIKGHSDNRYAVNPPSMKWEQLLYEEWLPKKYPDMEFTMPINVIQAKVKRQIRQEATRRVTEREKRYWVQEEIARKKQGGQG